MCIVEKDELYINFVNEKVEQVLGAVTTPIPPVKEYQGGEIFQFIIYCHPEEGKEWIKNTKKCKIHYWHQEGADILHIDSGKAASIQYMLGVYGFNREEIMVFGDGENDIDMISYAGIGVAMGNALEPVKKYADYVTDHIDEDGVMNALKYFSVL
jgi:Cof subfamily protein (haloacid dehalogenase superfamily)